MSLFKKGRYSGFLRPISYLIDLTLINGLSFLYFGDFLDKAYFIVFSSSIWIILSLYTNFYEVYRYTRELKIASLVLKQMAYFILLTFAFLGLRKETNIEASYILSYISVLFSAISLFKFSFYYFLQKYRITYGGNYRRIIILGKNKRSEALEQLFKKKPEYGYNHIKTFTLNKGTGVELQDCFDFIKNNDIDEVYCSVSELGNKQITQLIDFVDNNLKVLKFIPDNRDIYARRLRYEYYDYIPILWLRNIPLENQLNKFIKRSFDVVFALTIIFFLLSWLVPLVAILITLESKGPVFFRQQRNGFNNTKFYCYKFRSMTMNTDADLEQAKKGDARVTKVGRFIRKTSIDELPQFFNVLFGDMSVVGPRPHMLSHTTKYAKRVDKFMVRLFVKPGITGLAQIRGFRGEIENDKDIIGRVKFDIFYIENWSILLDIKIVLQTIANAIKGEEKAY